jgi:hypothetical protein
LQCFGEIGFRFVLVSTPSTENDLDLSGYISRSDLEMQTQA